MQKLSSLNEAQRSEESLSNQRLRVLCLPAALSEMTSIGISTEQSSSLADIYPPPPDGDDIVNFQDFVVLAENRLWGK